MNRAVARGMAVGVTAAALLAGWVILWPRRDGDFYEVSDPLIYLGLPLLGAGLVLGAVLGGLVGLVRGREREGFRPPGDRKSSP